MDAIEIKAFIPTKDFELSKQFYCDLGFDKKSEGGGVAYFSYGSCSFLLQDFYNEALCNNFVMHLLVSDVEQWHQYIKNNKIVEKYSVKCTDIETQVWQMRDFCLIDPSGVLWRIGQNI